MIGPDCPHISSSQTAGMRHGPAMRMRGGMCHIPSLIGALAQLGERLICIQEVRSSILLGSTIPRLRLVMAEPRGLWCANSQVNWRVAPPGRRRKWQDQPE